MDNLLQYFIKESEREFHIRALAKLTKLSPTTVSKYLVKFEKEGLLISERKYGHLLFKANVEDPNFKDLKIYYNIKNLRKSGFIDYLVEEYNYPKAIVLFGSFRKGENISRSDIDILIITSAKKKVNIEKFEKLLDNKVQLFIHSNKEIEGMKIKNKELVNNWINGIVLYGFWEVLR